MQLWFTKFNAKLIDRRWCEPQGTEVSATEPNSQCFLAIISITPLK
jgi:hypothetical protein